MPCRQRGTTEAREKELRGSLRCQSGTEQRFYHDEKGALIWEAYSGKKAALRPGR